MCVLERSCIFVIFCESFCNGLSSLFTVDVLWILVFGLCVLWLQNGIIGSKWVRVQTYFDENRTFWNLEFLFRWVKVFRIFISKESSFPLNVCFWGGCDGLRRSIALAECAGSWNTPWGWPCCACQNGEHSGAFWIAVQNVSLWEGYRMGLMRLILVFPCCLRCKRRQFLILEKYKYRIYCWLEVLRPSRTFSHKLLW